MAFERARAILREAVGLYTDPKTGQAAHGLLASVFPGGTGQPPVRGTREILLAYSTMPWLRATVNKVASSFAAVPWELYGLSRRGLGDARARRQTKALGRVAQPRARAQGLVTLRKAGHLETIEEHPLLTALDASNPYLTGLTLRKLLCIYHDLVGESFLVKERQRGVVTSLWPVPPSWVQATPTPSTPVYRVSYRGWQREVPEADVIWMADPDPELPYGRASGTARALTDELELDEYVAKHTKAFFANRARPDVIVSSSGADGATADELKRLEQDWLQQTLGAFRAWRPYFTNRKLDVQVLEQDFRCHSADTECLTRRGWVAGLDVTLDDEVATWSESRECLEWQRPVAVHRYPYEGPMHAWRNAQADQLVTPTHRLWFKGPSASSSWRFATSEEVRSGTHETHPRGRGRSRSLSGSWWMTWRSAGRDMSERETHVTIPRVMRERRRGVRQERPLHAYTMHASTFAPWLGYFLAEGHFASTRHHVALTQTTPTSELDGVALEMYRAALSIGPATLSRAHQLTAGGRTEWRISLANESLCRWLAKESGAGNSCLALRIPDCVFAWPLEARQALLDAMLAGDGSKGKREGSWRYGTSSRQLADDVQRLAIGLGLRARRSNPRKTTHVESYEVSLSPIGTVGVRECDLTIVPYRGDVWCLSVPNETLFVRRNGKVVVSGNSLQMVQLRQHERDTIISVYGLPPELVGVLTNSNRSTIQSAEYLMARHVLIPRLEHFRAQFQERLVPEYGPGFVLGYESPVEEDREYVLAAMRSAPTVRVNEWRAAQGQAPLTPEEGGELFLVGDRAVASFADLTPQAMPPELAAMLGGGGGAPAGAPTPPGAPAVEKPAASEPARPVEGADVEHASTSPAAKSLVEAILAEAGAATARHGRNGT